jgi:hypothetical protein
VVVSAAVSRLQPRRQGFCRILAITEREHQPIELDDHTHAIAAKLGNGNVSDGIRKALKQSTQNTPQKLRAIS